MAYMQGMPYEEEAFVAKVKEAYPDDHEKVLKLYPHGSKKEIEYSPTALASDRFIAYSPGNGLTCIASTVSSRCTAIYTTKFALHWWIRTMEINK